MTDICLRNARDGDVAILEAMAIAFKAQDRRPRTSRELAALHNLLTAPEHGSVLLIETDGQVIGYAILCWGFSIEYEGRDAILDELYVVPERRGSGIGQRVLELLIAQARTAGAKAIHLEVLADEMRAANLYRRAGWSDRGSLFMTRRLT